MKIWRILCALFLLSGSVAHAETVFVNGSFETGDYQGWTVTETPQYWEDPSSMQLWDLREYGTWGICENGEVLEYEGRFKFDYADSLSTMLMSPSLPHTCVPSEGTQLAFQLQNAGQVHVMAQDLSLPANASAISWEMMYKNHNDQTPYFQGDQRIRVAVKNLEGDLLEVLFLTDDSMSLEVSSWATYTADVSAYAGSSVRFEVEVSTFWQRLDAYFDNFRVELSDSVVYPESAPVEEVVEAPVTEAPTEGVAKTPPGWHKNVNLPKGLAQKEERPNGFDNGKKTGW